MWCFFLQSFDVFLALVLQVSTDRMWPALCWLSYLVFLANFRAEYLILYVKIYGCLYSCSWLRAFLIDYFSDFTQLALTHLYCSLFFRKFLSCCQHGEVWHLFVKHLNFCSIKFEMFQVLLGKSKMCWLPLFAGTFSDETDRILFVQWLLNFLLPRESK